MRTLTLSMAVAAVLFAARPAATEESEVEKFLRPLEMKLELEDAAPGYGKPVRVTAVIHNRSKRAVPFFHDAKMQGLLRFALVDRNGIVWKPVEAPTLLFPSVKYAGISFGFEHGVTSSIEPGGRFRLSYELSWFFPSNAPKEGPRWLSSLPLGTYTVRATYTHGNAFLPARKRHCRPGLVVSKPIIPRPLVPGMFMGRIEATAQIEVVAPLQETVEALRKRVRALEQENKRLRGMVEAARAALQPK